MNPDNKPNLQELASQFCQLFDGWILKQAEPVALSAALCFGPEYARLHELLTRLNTAVKDEPQREVTRSHRGTM